ncbi:unnamed protein product [Ascophyllum nodosum]
MKHSSLGGNSYVVIFVDDCNRFKVVKFVKKKSNTTAALLSLIADYITPQKLSIKCVRTDYGGEFEGEFQRELDRRSITHEHTPPDTSQYNGDAERALGLLREKTIILVEELDDVINVLREKLWAQAVLFACDITNKPVTTSTDGHKSPYELWFGKFPTADHLRPFGAVGYARQKLREHKMVPKGEKCVFMGIPHNFPTGTVSVLLVRTRKIVERQAVQWVDGPKKTGGDGTGSDDRGMKSAGDGTIVERGTPQLNVQELEQEQQLTLHEHETQEAFSEHEGETQGAFSKLEEETQETLSELEEETQETRGENQREVCATLDIREPQNRRQAIGSPEWDKWRKAEETVLLEMVETCIYNQVARPKDKLVVGTKMLYKRKIGQDGKVEKYRCRLVAQGFWQVEGAHYTEKYSPTPATASIRMFLAMAATKDGELRLFDAEQALLKADIDEEIYIEIPEEFQEFSGAFCDDMTAIGFEQAKADPCVIRKVVDGEADMVVVVHVDDILVNAKVQATMDRFAAELGQKFKLKDMGDAGYYMGCHITRDRKACELKLDQHLYVESMVKRFDVKKATKIPAASGVPTLSKADEPRNPEEKEEIRRFPYRGAVGALMWTATMTRPDIACAIRAVARFCENPGPAHKKAVMKILQYLLHTK